MISGIEEKLLLRITKGNTIYKYFKKSVIPIIGGIDDFGRTWFTFLILPRGKAFQTQKRAGQCATNKKHLEVEDWPNSILM